MDPPTSALPFQPAVCLSRLTGCCHVANAWHAHFCSTIRGQSLQADLLLFTSRQARSHAHGRCSTIVETYPVRASHCSYRRAPLSGAALWWSTSVRLTSLPSGCPPHSLYVNSRPSTLRPSHSLVGSPPPHPLLSPSATLPPSVCLRRRWRAGATASMWWAAAPWWIARVGGRCWLGALGCC